MFLFLAVFGVLLNNIGKTLSLPNIFTLIRVLTLFLILLIINKKILRHKYLSYFYLSLIFFVFCYLTISVLQGKLGYGLYFIRIYLEVLLVFYLSLYIKFFFNLKRFIDSIKFIGLLSSFFSLFTLYLFYTNSTFLNIIHASDEINFNWFLGIGKFIYRAGFPIGGPNQLGLFYSILIILSINFPFISKKKNTFYLSIFTLGLISTFSKSAILVILIYIILHNFKKISIFFYLIVISVFSFYLLTLLDQYILEGRFLNYLDGFINSKDESTEGHSNSILNAVYTFSEYSLSGYPKGTVGPRAQLFTDKYKNVESSFFIVLYDMGLLVAFIYTTTITFLLKYAFSNKYQFYFLVSIFPVYFFLPVIHNIEISSLVFLIYVLIGSNKT